MSTNILSAANVAIIARTAKSTKSRTKAEAYTLLKACDRRLGQFTAGTLVLAEDVRLPKNAVISLLWKVRKIALAQWKAARAEQAPALPLIDTTEEQHAEREYAAMALPYIADANGEPLFI